METNKDVHEKVRFFMNKSYFFIIFGMRDHEKK